MWFNLFETANQCEVVSICPRGIFTVTRWRREEPHGHNIRCNPNPTGQVAHWIRLLWSHRWMQTSSGTSKSPQLILFLSPPPPPLHFPPGLSPNFRLSSYDPGCPRETQKSSICGPDFDTLPWRPTQWNACSAVDKGLIYIIRELRFV